MPPRPRLHEISARLAQFVDVSLPPPVERRVRTVARRLARRASHLAGRLEGLAYRLGDQRPDPGVDDAVLVQRVRSSLGPLERRLDLPRLHVTSTDHVVDLHGVVTSETQARRLEEAVAGVSGVASVRSHLHVGMGPGDTRPSVGRATAAPSRAWRELVGAARGAGLDDDAAARGVQAVLATLLRCLPEGERGHVLAHLPEDVRSNAQPPLEVGRPARPRTVRGFERSVAEGAQLRADDAALVARVVLDALRALVPEEVTDVEAVLPAGLKPLWASPMVVEH